MDRAYQSGAAGSAPAAPVSPSIGYPTAGNPATATPATKPGPYWYHMITEEMRAVIAAAGLTPSQSDLTQLLQALPGALASRPEMARSLAANGYQKLPSGLIIQWGSVQSANIATTTVNYPIAFPNNCFQVVASGYNVSGGVQAMVTANSPSGLSSASFNAFYAGTPGVPMSLAGTSQVRIQYIAIGN